MWSYNYTNGDELYHYGVKGMKWGVHRARRAYKKGDYNKSLSIVNKHQKKIIKKNTKLDKKYSKLSKIRDKQVLKNDVKVNEYRNKAYKLDDKANGFFTSESKKQKLTSKASELRSQADRLESQSNKTKAEINKNRRLKEIFDSGYKDLEQTKIDIGKKEMKQLIDAEKEDDK